MESPPVPQLVTSPVTRTAIFLVVSMRSKEGSAGKIRGMCRDLGALVRSIGHRSSEGQLSCIISFGSNAWDYIFGTPRPAELHPFQEIIADDRRAVSTPGDILFHIKAQRMDLCFELASQLMARLGEVVSPVDEVHGFRYFDSRGLIGFVDGTENPTDLAALEATLIGDEDLSFKAGSYVIVQKYLHDLSRWNSISTEEQERIIGRTKLSDIEMDEAVKPTFSHVALNKVVENGREIKILRDNMPFGQAGMGEFGTYFIGYSRSPRTIEQMLRNMFVGNPPGNYDRLLDTSHPVTGGLFFVPSATFLENVKAD